MKSADVLVLLLMASAQVLAAATAAQPTDALTTATAPTNTSARKPKDTATDSPTATDPTTATDLSTATDSPTATLASTQDAAPQATQTTAAAQLAAASSAPTGPPSPPSPPSPASRAPEHGESVTAATTVSANQTADASTSAPESNDAGLTFDIVNQTENPKGTKAGKTNKMTEENRGVAPPTTAPPVTAMGERGAGSQTGSDGKTAESDKRLWWLVLLAILPLAGAAIYRQFRCNKLHDHTEIMEAGTENASFQSRPESAKDGVMLLGVKTSAVDENAAGR